MGTRTENLLLDDAVEFGYVGIRVDFGGGAGYHSPHDAGDLILGRSLEDPDYFYGVPAASELIIVEEKYKSTDANRYLQEDGEKLDAMIEFAEAIGAQPVLACRWSTQLDWSPGATHFLRDAREVDRTGAGNVSVKPETAENEFASTSEFFDR